MFKIYVSTYERYNNGSLRGEWIKLPTTESRLISALSRIASPRPYYEPEYMIQDSETDGDFRAINEDEDIFRLNKEVRQYTEQKAAEKAEEKAGKINPAALELAKEFREKRWPKDAEMQAYCIGQISNAYKLECGKIVEFQKPSIKTRFCFSEDINGMYDEELSEWAREMARKAETREYFMCANLAQFDEYKKMLDDDFLYIVPNRFYTDGNKTEESISAEIKTRRYMVNFELDKLETAERLTAEDRAGLKKICDEEKAKFEKRIAAWWKRFGSSGIRSWTYCSD